MKTKNLIIIFILFLIIALAGGLSILLNREKRQSVLNVASGIISPSSQPVAAGIKSDEAVKKQPILETAVQAKPTVLSEKNTPPVVVDKSAEEKIQAKMLLNGVEYGAAIKVGDSAYDLMSELREQKKIDFKDRNYSGLGFFIEEINGVKNNPAGKNWVYYINGQPGKVGVSFYKLKDNDVIEWKYEKKSF